MLPILLACSAGPGPTPALALAEASREVNFQSMTALGSFTLDASIRRETLGGRSSHPATTETLSLRWRDQDHWSAMRTMDGRTSVQTVVFEGVARIADSRGRWKNVPDPEPYRVDLAHTWDPWTVALDPFTRRAVFEAAGTDEIEGRGVHIFTVGLAPSPPAGRAGGWSPVSLEGKVWIDDATAVRLLVDLVAEARSGEETSRWSLKMSVNGIGLDPAVRKPESPQ